MQSKAVLTISTVLLLVLIGCATMDSRWQEATSTDTVQGYEAFLKRYPDSSYTPRAREKIEALCWEQAKKNNTLSSYEAFLKRYPESNYTLQARERIEALHWEQAKKSNTLSSYETFIRKYPNSSFLMQAQEELKSFAKIVPSMPNTIPHRGWSSDGWLYEYTVTFTETRGVSATVEWVRRVYRDKSGMEWASEFSGHRESIKIGGNGSNSYSSWVRGDVSPDLRGGTVTVDYSGHDENGHSFDGSVSSKLARPMQ